MARRKILDLTKLGNKFSHQPTVYKLIWLGLLTLADNYGLGVCSPIKIAQAFGEYELNNEIFSLEDVKNAINFLASGDDPSIALWSENDTTFYAICKYQDYQKIRQPGNPNCPLPPPEVLEKLTPATAGALLRNLNRFTSGVQKNSVKVLNKIAKLSGNHPNKIAKTSENNPNKIRKVSGLYEIGDRRYEIGDRSNSSPEISEIDDDSGCALCRTPLRNGPEETLVQMLHDSFRRKFGVCPTWTVDSALAMIKRLVNAGKSSTNIIEAWKSYLNDGDAFVKDNGYSLSLFVNRFNSYEIKRQEAHVADEYYNPNLTDEQNEVMRAWLRGNLSLEERDAKLDELGADT